MNFIKAPLFKKRTKNLLMVAGGMTGILIGGKLVPLALFAKGFRGLEQGWQEAHPEFSGSRKMRWDEAIEFYERSHQNKVNRALHMVGIPMIVGGVAGMLVFPRYSPPWVLGASNYFWGWILNFIGHGVFEKGAPAFADDPLSFLAGPIWDFAQLKNLFCPKA